MSLFPLLHIMLKAYKMFSVPAASISSILACRSFIRVSTHVSRIKTLSILNYSHSVVFDRYIRPVRILNFRSNFIVKILHSTSGPSTLGKSQKFWRRNSRAHTVSEFVFRSPEISTMPGSVPEQTTNIGFGDYPLKTMVST